MQGDLGLSAIQLCNAAIQKALRQQASATRVCPVGRVSSATVAYGASEPYQLQLRGVGCILRAY